MSFTGNERDVACLTKGNMDLRGLEDGERGKTTVVVMFLYRDHLSAGYQVILPDIDPMNRKTGLPILPP